MFFGVVGLCGVVGCRVDVLIVFFDEVGVVECFVFGVILVLYVYVVV